jgi:hypothetical protein
MPIILTDGKLQAKSWFTEKKEAIALSMPLTVNPFIQTPKTNLSKRQQVMQAFAAAHSDKPWRVCVRPVGPDDQSIFQAGIWFVADEWHTVGRYTYQTRDEAVEKIRILGGLSLRQVSENEWILYGNRYRARKT